MNKAKIFRYILEFYSAFCLLYIIFHIPIDHGIDEAIINHPIIIVTGIISAIIAGRIVNKYKLNNKPKS